MRRSAKDEAEAERMRAWLYAPPGRPQRAGRRGTARPAPAGAAAHTVGAAVPAAAAGRAAARPPAMTRDQALAMMRAVTAEDAQLSSRGRAR